MFALDPQSIADRAKASSTPPKLPSLAESVLRGTLGFTVVSLGGFAPWVFAGRWLHQNVSEAGLYAVCAVMFIGLSGWLLHRLIIGPGSLIPFYKIFGPAFLAYAIVWTIAWISLRRSTGGAMAGIIGGLSGIAVMGLILAWGFKALDAAWKIIVVLIATNLAGYFIGEQAYSGVLALKEGNALGIVLEKSTRSILSKTAWGLFYGLGFGAGIGFAFYACQAKARRLIAGQP